MITFLVLLLAAGPAGARSPSEFIIGGDITSLPNLESHGAVFRENGVERGAIEILRSNGFNCARIRFYVTPDGLWGAREDIEYAVRLAHRAKAAGMKILIDLHCADTWSDPGHQSKPKKWKDLDFPGLRKAMREYGKEVITVFKAAGVLPELIQVGNEVDGGILWPDGKVWGEGAGGWAQFAELIRAAQLGINDGLSDGETVKFVHHIASAEKGDWHFSKLFAQEAQVQVDYIGFSYYPWWSGDLESLRRRLEGIATKFKRDIIIVETAHGWTDGYLDSWNNVFWPKKHPAVDFPPTKDGQKQFVEGLIDVVTGLQDSRGAGLIWWEPAWLGVKEPRDYLAGELRNHTDSGVEMPSYGSPVENICLFDFDGNILPALEVFRGINERN